MTAHYRSDYTKPGPYYQTRHLTEFLEVSKEHLRQVRNVDRGRLFLWTPGPVLFGTCICSTC